MLSFADRWLRITGSCVGAAHTLWEIRNAWKRAPVTVSTLCSQLKLTAASLSQIQSLLLGETDILHNKPDLVDTFDTTLTSCLVLSSWLEKFMLKIKKGALEGSKTTWKTKFMIIWDESDIKELLEQLHTQQTAISMLVNLLQVDSLSEIRKLVQRYDTLLREIAHNTRRTRRTHAPDARLSILRAEGHEESIFSQLIDDRDIEEMEFESLILNNKVYSNASTAALKPDTHDDESEDARTTIETQSFSSMMISKTPIVTVTRDALAEAHPFAIDAPEIGPLYQKLGITGIQACALYNYIACSENKLSFKASNWMNNIKQLTKSRYHGSVQGNWGYFDRKMVLVSFALGSPLQTRTVNTALKPLNNSYLTHKNGERLFVSRIQHSPMWLARHQNHYGSGDENSRLVYVCDLELDEAVEQDVNRLLEFFSCPMPALVSLSQYEQRRQMRNIIWQDGNHVELFEMLAHWSSFKELQYVASEIKKWKEELRANNQ